MKEWNTSETVKELIRKSGFKGDEAIQLDESMKCTRYQSSTYTAKYSDLMTS